MTEVGDGLVIIAAEAPTKCEACGEVRETRPYGFRGQRICFNCFQSGTPELKEHVKATFTKLVMGESP